MSVRRSGGADEPASLSRQAAHPSGRWIHVMHHPRWLWGEFRDFLLEGVDSAPELDSRPALLPKVAGTSSTTAVACSMLVLLVLTLLALCSHDCRQSAEKCTVDFCVALEMHLEICTSFLRASCIFSACSASNFCASRFFGALEHSHL